MSRKFLTLSAVGLTASAALVLAGCSSGGESTATGEPIAVAATASLSMVPDATDATRAVFDAYNAAGGLDGRPIELEIYDDRADPATAATAASSVVASDAIALVGTASLLDCAVNGQTWVDSEIVSIPGIATDPFCFANPNISPTNSGAFYGTFASLYNGSENHGYERICAVQVYDDAVGAEIFRQAFEAWGNATGQELVYLDDTLTRGQASYAGNVSALKSQECDAVFINELGDAVVGFLGEATNQGIDLPILALTSTYSDDFAAAVTNYGGEVLVPAEFVPYNDTENAAVVEWAEAMDEAGVPKTSFAQGGYLAAKYFIEILESIEGEITRASFTDAAKGQTTPIDSPMTEGTWIMGEGAAHQPNTKAWPVALEPGSGAWVVDGAALDGNEIGWVATDLTFLTN